MPTAGRLGGVASSVLSRDAPPVGIAVWATEPGQCLFPLPGPPDSPAHPPTAQPAASLAASLPGRDTWERGSQCSRACPAVSALLPGILFSGSQSGRETHLVRDTIEWVGPPLSGSLHPCTWQVRTQVPDVTQQVRGLWRLKERKGRKGQGLSCGRSQHS